MSSNAIMNPENAPRSEEELASQGVFIHRRLAESLTDRGFKLWNSEKEKTAFITASPGDRAKVLAVKLREMDAASGGTPPAALAASNPAPATTAAPEHAKRAPKTSNGASDKQMALPGTQSPQASTAGVQELLIAIKSLQGDLEEVSKGMVAISNNQNILAKEIAGIKASVGSSAAIQNAQLGLLCLFGQQVLGGVGMEDFLPASIEDAAKALKIFEKLGKG